MFFSRCKRALSSFRHLMPYFCRKPLQVYSTGWLCHLTSASFMFRRVTGCCSKLHLEVYARRTKQSQPQASIHNIMHQQPINSLHNFQESKNIIPSIIFLNNSYYKWMVSEIQVWSASVAFISTRNNAVLYKISERCPTAYMQYERAFEKLNAAVLKWRNDSSSY